MTEPTPAAIEAAFIELCRLYVQCTDDRHKSMGLQYTGAETHDLAKWAAGFAERARREGWEVGREAAAAKANAVRIRCADNASAIKRSSAGKASLTLDQLKEVNWHIGGQRHAATEIETAIRALTPLSQGGEG